MYYKGSCRSNRIQSTCNSGGLGVARFSLGDRSGLAAALEAAALSPPERGVSKVYQTTGAFPLGS